MFKQLIGQIAEIIKVKPKTSGIYALGDSHVGPKQEFFPSPSLKTPWELYSHFAAARLGQPLHRFAQGGAASSKTYNANGIVIKGLADQTAAVLASGQNFRAGIISFGTNDLVHLESMASVQAAEPFHMDALKKLSPRTERIVIVKMFSLSDAPHYVEKYSASDRNKLGALCFHWNLMIDRVAAKFPNVVTVDLELHKREYVARTGKNPWLDGYHFNSEFHHDFSTAVAAKLRR